MEQKMNHDGQSVAESVNATNMVASVKPKKSFNELTDKVYNEFLNIYHDFTVTHFDYIEDDIYDKCTESNEYTGSIRLSDGSSNDLDVMLEQLAVNKDELSEEEYDELLETMEEAECKAYEDNLDSLKEKGYDVEYNWEDEFINFTVTKA